MRLRDLPGLADQVDKLIQQIKGYADRLPQKAKGTPYTSAGKKKRKLEWE